jgi:hypothetical protein
VGHPYVVGDAVVQLAAYALPLCRLRERGKLADPGALPLLLKLAAPG